MRLPLPSLRLLRRRKKPLPDKKSALSKPKAAPAAKSAPVKKAPPARREPVAKKAAPQKPAPKAKAPPPKAASKAPAPKPAAKPVPVAKKVEPKAAKPDTKAKVETKAPAKPEPKTAAKAQPKAAAKPEPKAKAEPKGKTAKAPIIEDKKPTTKGKPLPAETKAPPPPKPPKPPKAPKVKAEKPPKPPKLAPVAAAFAKPMPAKPLAVAAGRAQPILRSPTTPVRVAPKPLAAPKPVVSEPELVGDSQAVPAFKAKTGAKGMVLVGAVAGAFGVKGEVRLRAFTDKKDGVISYGPLYGEDGKILLKPKSWRELKDGVAVVAPEVKTREQAEEMRGVRLFVPRANLPATAEDEFYIVDLLGCRAETIDGQVLGEIIAVWNFGAGDIIEYRPPNGGPNVRITFTKETAPLVDLAGKRVVLDPPAPEPIGK